MQSLRTTTSDSLRVAECARELLETAPIVIRYIRHHMRRHRRGLSVPQFRALYKVRSQPGASLSVVAEHLAASLPTSSRIVGALVAKGFLVRSDAVTDRRQVALYITPRGRSIVDASHAATQAQMEARLAGVSAADCEAISRAMVVLNSILGDACVPDDQPVMTVSKRRRRPAAALSPA